MSAALESSTTNVVNFSLIRFNRRQNNQKKSFLGICMNKGIRITL